MHVRWSAALLTVIAVASCRSGGIGPRRAAPVILISIDTLRADHLPMYGYRSVRTPALDTLAGDGIVFENAYAHSPQTLPSHVSILSGRLPFDHGVRDNVGFAVRRDEVLVPAILHAHGFATGGFASAYVLREETGIARGFDRYDARLPPSSPEIAVGELQRDGEATLAAANQWLDGLTSNRFFLFLHLYEPHSPYRPPKRFREYAPYDGEIAHADEIVGSLTASLKRRGAYDDALIVLLSDHGEGLGDHGEQEHGLFLYRETIRVPLTIKLPRQRAAGRRITTPVQHIDVVPTILDWLQLPAQAGLRGRSLGPLFTGGTIRETGIYAEALYPRYHFGWSELYALSNAQYRFIRAPRDELYDIQQDAGERRNLATDRTATRMAMRTALDQLLASTTIDMPGTVSPETLARLRTLGYVGVKPPPEAETATTQRSDPKDKVRVLERYRAALAQVQRGDFAGALANFHAIVEENPLMADVWSEIGGLELRLGRRDAALSVFKRLVEAAPYDPAALINVADTLLLLGRLDEAQAQAALAVDATAANDPRWRAKAHQTLAMIALARRDDRQARAEAGRVREIDPTLPMTDYVEGLIRYNAGEFHAAVPFFDRALKTSAERTVQLPELRYYFGDALARMERYSEAEPVLADEVRLFPYDLRARAALAMLYRATNRAQDSDREVDAIERVAPTAEGRALAGQLRRMFGTR